MELKANSSESRHMIQQRGEIGFAQSDGRAKAGRRARSFTNRSWSNELMESVMSDIRVTVLAENAVYRRGLRAEHGLPLWIETTNKKILFDTGQSDLLLHNAKTLGIDVAEVDAIVASQTRVQKTIDALRRFDIDQIAPAHCTGRQAARQLWNSLGDRCFLCCVGMQVSFWTAKDRHKVESDR